MRQLIPILMIFIFASSVFAQQSSYGTYSLYPQGSSRAMGMGGAYTALSEDPAGMVFNPAGLSLSKWEFDFGGTNNSISQKESGLFGPSQVSQSYNFFFGALGVRLGSWVLAVGVSSPYFLDYDQNSVKAQLKILSMDALIAKKFGDSFGIGISAHSEDLTQSYGDTLNPEVEGKATSFYPRAGIIYRKDKWRLGASYMPSHKFDIDENLNSRLTGITYFRDCIVPAKTTVGIAVKISEGKTLAIDYDRYGIVEDAILVGSGTSVSNTPTAIKEEAQSVLHGGLEMDIMGGSKSDAIFRVGGYTEPSRIEGMSGRSHLTLGLDVRFGPVVLSVAFDQATNFSNTAQGFTVRVGDI